MGHLERSDQAMKEKETALRVLALPIMTGLLLLWCGCRPPERNPEPASDTRREQLDQLYATYDQQFLAFLANAVQAVGKETIKVERLSEGYTVPKKLTLRGSPYEVGLTIGHIVRQCGLTLPRRTQANRARNEALVAWYRQAYPKYLEQMRGTAAAMGVGFDGIDLTQMEYPFFVRMWLDLLLYRDFYNLAAYGSAASVETESLCSVASYWTGERHFAGRNFDNPSDRPHYFADTRMDGSYRVLGHVIYGIHFWVVDGVNEKGLSMNVASNGGGYFLTEPYPGEAAVFQGQMGRIVLDTCATVGEALKVIGSVRVWFPTEGIHWLIADATGKAVVVEFDLQQRMVVLDKPGPYELMTNTALQLGEDFVMSDCWRYRQARPQLEAGVADMAGMFTIMRAIRPSGGVRSLWTTIMDLNRRRFEVHYDKEYERAFEFHF